MPVCGHVDRLRRECQNKRCHSSRKRPPGARVQILCPHCQNAVVVERHTPDARCDSCGSSFAVHEGATASWTPVAGRTLGKFELLEMVGEGAFGSVFKARDPELDRIVAIKTPRGGSVIGGQELERFLREARSTAQLRHPAIVSVHEVATLDGVPYIVSDFVHGVTLADQLTARRPSPREAALLVATIAEALHYAHEQGVVHRDVKPSNIMLDEHSQVRLMDFGLAKRDAGDATVTTDGQVLGTPAYMSPEQARGEGRSVDRRGDVYSVGVVLYELLTGELPFRGNVRMMLHQVLSDEPRPPRSLNDNIERDLETICLKAMAKEPGRRYATAAALADDLRRYRAGEPIVARPVGRIEKLWRWARRNRAVAALSASLLIVLTGALVGMFGLWRLAERRGDEAIRERDNADEQRRLAERNFQQAQDAVNEAMTLVAEDPALADRLPELRRSLLGATLKYYEAFVEQRGDDPGLQEERFRAYVRVADINKLMGSMEQALDALRRATDLIEAQLRLNPADADARRSLSECYYQAGLIHLAMEKPDDARSASEKSLALRQQLLDEHPADESSQADVAQSENQMGILLDHIYRASEAREHYERAIAQWEKLIRVDPQNSNYESQLGGSWNNLASCLYGLEQPQAAREAILKAIEHQERALKLAPDHREHAEFLANHDFNLAKMDAGSARPADALKGFERARDRYQQLLRANPSVTGWRIQWARSCLEIGRLYARGAQPDWDESRRCLEQALSAFEQLAAENTAMPQLHERVAETHRELADVLLAGGRRDEALRHWQSAVTLMKEHLADDPLNRESHLSNLMRCQTRIGDQHFVARRLNDAVAAWQEALATGEVLVKEFPDGRGHRDDLAYVCNSLGLALVRAGQQSPAETMYRRAIELRESLSMETEIDNAVNLGGAWCNLGNLLGRARATDALAAYEQAAKLLDGVIRTHPDYDVAREYFANTVSGWTDLLLQQDRGDEAMRVLDHALETDDGSQGDRFRLARALLLARLGRHAEASAEGDRIDPDGASDYNLACLWALVSAAVAADAKLAVAERDPLAERYAARSVEFLRREFADDQTNVSLLERDTDLDVLRKRSDFQQLVLRLKVPRGSP